MPPLLLRVVFTHTQLSASALLHVCRYMEHPTGFEPASYLQLPLAPFVAERDTGALILTVAAV